MAALEGVWFGDNLDEGPGLGATGILGFRRGLVDRVDFGMRFVLDFRADLKVQLVRSRVFNLAIALTIWLGYLRWVQTVSDVATPPFGGVLVAVASVDFGSDASLVFHIGGGYDVNPRHRFDLPTVVRHGPRGEFGLGVQIPVTEKISIQPEATAIIFWGDTGDVEYGVVFGVGVLRGDLPSLGQ